MSAVRLTCSVAEACGGCPQIGLTSARQRDAKLAEIRRQAQAEGLALPPLQWLGASVAAGYRNRIRLRLEAGVPQFFNPDKSSECAVLRQELREALPSLRDWAAAQRDVLALFSHLELRAPDADGLGALTLFFPAGRGTSRSSLPGEGPPDPVLSCRIMPFKDWLMFRDSWPEKRSSTDVPHQRFTLSDDVYTYVPVTGFMQVNSAMNREMVALVRQIARASGAGTFLELFCGSGNLSLPLLRDGLSGAGAEIDPVAIAALRRAASAQDLDAAGFVAGDARTGLFSHAKPVDLLIMDPPRAGLRGEVGDWAALAGGLVLLCHCHLVSFVRDAVALVRSGFSLERVVAIDMFPHTAQIELLTLLRAEPRHG